MTKRSQKYIVTSALPYANGDLHIGHIAGAYLPADIFVRYLRLQGQDVVFISGTDEHGVPITITAEKEGKTPKEIIDYYWKRQDKAFRDLGIKFDIFSRTSKKIHHQTAQEFFLKIYKKGYITKKKEKQFYCKNCKRFLPDRYIEGECPECGSSHARGDQCEQCGKWLCPQDLKSPVCKVCGKSNLEVRETEHWFFELSKLKKWLEEWLRGKKSWKKNVRDFCLNLVKKGLPARPITRDLKWGIKVPLKEATNKVIYVWFEAPIGYISATKDLAQKIGKKDEWKKYWLNPVPERSEWHRAGSNKNTKLVQYIGKDNIVFHALIWPAILKAYGGYVIPTDIPANEFLNIKGAKQSKSRNYAVWVLDYLKKFEPDPLRFYLELNAPENKDADFTWKDFQEVNNKILANILGNFINRTISFANKNFGGRIPAAKNLKEADKKGLASREKSAQKTAAHLEKYEVSKGVKEFIKLARFGNQYFDQKKPWDKIKTDKQDAANTLYVCLNIVYSLSVIGAPFLPFTALKILNQLDIKKDLSGLCWSDAEKLLKSGQKIKKPEIIFRKIEDKEIGKEEKKLQK